MSKRLLVVPAFLLALLVVFAVASAQAAPGDLDTSFGTGGKVVTDFGAGNDYAAAVAIQPNGKIVAGGDAQIGSTLGFAVARYNANGSLDSSFGTGGKVTTGFGGSQGAWIDGIALQKDGKIVAAGQGRSGTTAAFGLARYNANGSLDTSFGSGGLVATTFGTGNTRVNGIALQPDGKIVTAGFDKNATEFEFALARYNADGSLDTSFGTGGGKVTTDFGSGIDVAWAVAVQPDGKIVAAGYAFATGHPYLIALARYNADGSLDTSFGSGGRVTTAISDRYDLAFAMTLQPDGKIVVVGETRGSTATKYDAAVVRYTPAGALDTTFGSGGKVTTAYATDNDGFEAVAVQLNGKIVAGGWTKQGTPPLYKVSLARYNPNGSLDTTFGVGGKVVTVWGGHDDYITGIALQADGKIVGVGAADKSTTFSDYEFALARYQGDTCVVPKLKGRKLAGAKTLIKRATCKVGKVKKRFSKKVKKGRVISQKPAAGTKVASATPVNLVASKGPKRLR